MLREALHRIRLRLLALVHRRRLDRDLDDELAFHVAMRAEKYRAEGLGAEPAQAAAERRFGNVLSLKEACRHLWTLNGVEHVVQDLRYGVRMLRRSPGFTAVVVATLTLGVGASTATLSFLDLRPLPVSQPEQLVLLHWATEESTGWDAGQALQGCEDLHIARFEDCMVPYPIYRRVSEQTRSFAGMAVFSNPTDVQVRLGGEAAHAPVQFTSGNYFSVLGVGAGLGRTLNPSDDRESAEPVAVLSHRYWRERLGGDPNVVGEVLVVNGASLTVVGVAPESFFGLDATNVPAMWIPVHTGVRLTKGPSDVLHRLLSDRAQLLATIARLKSGVGVREGGAELQAAFEQVLTVGPESPWKDRPRVVLSTASHGLNALQYSYGRPLRLLRAGVALVLVVVCANIANLLLARASVRRREIAVRLALGAGRGRVLAQLITEGLLLSALGTAGGLLLGLWSSRALAVVLVPGIETAAFAWSRPSGFLLGVVALLSVFTTVVLGLVPAWAAWRVAPARDLHPGGVGRDGTRTLNLGRWIVSGEVAIALLLLVGAGLLVRTVVNLVTFDPGFRTDHLLTVEVESVFDSGQPSTVGEHAHALRDRLGALPGVLSATWASEPLLGQRFRIGAILMGEGPNFKTEMVDRLSVGPGFFETVGMPLLAGRRVEAGDMGKGAPAVWINRAFAERFPDQQSVGAAVRLLGSVRSEVAGIVGNARHGYIQRPINPTVYVPEPAEAHNFILRTAIDPLALAASARNAVRSVSPRLLVKSARDERLFLAANTSQERLLVGVSLGLAGLVLVLAAIGVYGVLSYSVAQRTSEIAIRMSLGALRKDVLNLVLKEGLRVVCVGAALGVLAAYWAARFLTAFLFEVKPLDPLTFLGATVLLVAVAAVAAYLPAARASGVDPLVALRSE